MVFIWIEQEKLKYSSITSITIPKCLNSLSILLTLSLIVRFGSVDNRLNLFFDIFLLIFTNTFKVQKRKEKLRNLQNLRKNLEHQKEKHLQNLWNR